MMRLGIFLASLWIILVRSEVLRLGFLGGRRWYHANAVSNAKVAMRIVNMKAVIPNVEFDIIVETFEELTQQAAFESAVRLVEQGVIGIIGTESSETLQLAAIYASSRGIPVISHGSVSTELTDKKDGLQYLFRAQPTIASQHRLLAHISLYFDWKNVCYMSVLDRTTASQLTNLIVKYTDPTNINIKASGLYNRNLENTILIESLDVALNALQNSGCRIIAYGGSFEEQDQVVARARDLGHFDKYVWISLANYLRSIANDEIEVTSSVVDLYDHVYSIENDEQRTRTLKRATGDASIAEREAQQELMTFFYENYSNLTVPYSCKDQAGQNVFSGTVNDPIYDFVVASSYPDADPPLYDGPRGPACIDGNDFPDQTNVGANTVFDIVFIYAQALKRVYDTISIDRKREWPRTLDLSSLREALLKTDFTGISSRYRFDPVSQDVIAGMAMYSFIKNQSRLQATTLFRTTDAYYDQTEVKPGFIEPLVNTISWPSSVNPRPEYPYDGSEVSALRSSYRNGLGQRLLSKAGIQYELIDLLDYFGQSPPAHGTTLNVSVYDQSTQEYTISQMSVPANTSTINISYLIMSSGNYDLSVTDIYTNELVAGSSISLILSCPSGTGWQSNSAENNYGRCARCPDGQEGINGRCRPCPVGKYRRLKDTSSLFCLPCSLDSFADTTGSSSCTQCPKNSVRDESAQLALLISDPSTSAARFDLTFGTNLSECTCPPGYYTTGGDRKDAKMDGVKWGAHGFECLECPEGATCQGGTYAPQNKRGWWGIRKYGGHRTRRFYECNPPSRCAAEYKCTRGRQHASQLCSVLKPFRFFQIGGLKPERCIFGHSAISRTIFYAFVLAGVFFVWLYFNLYVGAAHSSLALMNHGLQMMAIISLFDTSYPRHTSAWLEILFSFSLFDADVLTPSCVMRWRQIHSLYAAILVSCFGIVFFIPLSLQLIRRSVFDPKFVIENERIFRRIMAQPRLNLKSTSSMSSLMHSSETDDIEPRRRSCFYWIFLGWPRALRIACHFYIGEYGVPAATCVANAQILIDANFANTLVKFLLATNCTNGGRMRLDPTIRCRSFKHWCIIIVAGLGCLILLGYALGLAFMIKDGYRRVNGLHEPHLLARYGWLYGEYASPLHMCSMLLIIETFLFSIIAAYAPGRDLQLALASFVCLFSASLYTYLRPFELDRYNILRVASCFAVGSFTFASLISRRDAPMGIVSSVVVLVAIGSLFCLTVWLCYLEVVEDNARFILRRRLLSRFGIMQLAGKEGRFIFIPKKVSSGLRQTLERQLRMSGTLFASIAPRRESLPTRFSSVEARQVLTEQDSVSSTSSIVQERPRSWKGRPRRMYRAPLPSDLVILSGDFNRSESFDEEHSTGNSSSSSENILHARSDRAQSLGHALDELVYAVSGVVNTGSIFEKASTRQEEESRLLERVANILKPNISQESPLSPYSANFKASFWRVLARAYPGIISFAAESLNDHERRIVFAVLVKLQRFLEHSETDSRARALDFAVEEHARSAILYSILSAPEQADADAIATVFRSPLKLIASSTLSSMQFLALPKSVKAYLRGSAAIKTKESNIPNWLPFSFAGSKTYASVDKEHDSRESAALVYLERHHHNLIRGFGTRGTDHVDALLGAHNQESKLYQDQSSLHDIKHFASVSTIVSVPIEEQQPPLSRQEDEAKGGLHDDASTSSSSSSSSSSSASSSSSHLDTS